MVISGRDALERRNGIGPPLLASLKALPPSLLLAIAMVATAALLAVVKGPVETGQATLNGLVGASYFALGAVGLTLVFGILRLVNFAHGDLLTVGAYVAIGMAATGLPFWISAGIGIAATAAIATSLDHLVWAPLRRAGASTLQSFLAAIGLALVLRYVVQFFAGSQVRRVGLDVLSAVDIGPWHLGTLQLLVMVVGLATIILTGLGLRFTMLGKQMRALADNMALAEATGIDTLRTVRITWAVGGGLAALAGILYAAAIGSISPNFGVTILLSLFAAAVLGGIGNAYGALAGGIVIGLAQEWSTLLFNPRWKPAVGFAILILTLFLLPRGIFGRKRART